MVNPKQIYIQRTSVGVLLQRISTIPECHKVWWLITFTLRVKVFYREFKSFPAVFCSGERKQNYSNYCVLHFLFWPSELSSVFFCKIVFRKNTLGWWCRHRLTAARRVVCASKFAWQFSVLWKLIDIKHDVVRHQSLFNCPAKNLQK